MFIISVSNPEKKCGSVYYAHSFDLVAVDCIHPSDDDQVLDDCISVAERDGCDRAVIVDIGLESMRAVPIASSVKVYVMNDEGATVAKFD